MNRRIYYIILFILCLISVNTQAQDSIMKLQKDMYFHYSKHNTAEFMKTVESLKKLAKSKNEDNIYYKAYGNQAIYVSTNMSRGEGIDLAKAIFKEARESNNQFGLYTANYVTGVIDAALQEYDEALHHYQEAEKILKQHYPDESRSPLYLAMTKIYRAKKNTKGVREYVEYVLADPKATKQHRLSALSYKYIALRDQRAPQEELDKAYEERKKLIAEYGHDDNLGYIVDFEHAVMHDNLKKAEEIVENISWKNRPTKLLYYAKLNYAKEDYKKAYNYYERYKTASDSVNNDNVRKTSLDVNMLIDKAKAETEARELRLENQRYEMERIQAKLKQEELAKSNLSMSLDYQKALVKGLEAERQNDSLMANYKDLQLADYHTQLQARESEERNRQMKWMAGGLLALVAFIFVAIYANIRRIQLRQLKEAYDKLEETTTAKERIESELRIAREIQMGMVPHEFPSSKRLDVYATMTPAKEVGGDLYDFVVIGDNLYFCVGDVSGKGVPAALFMAMSARLFRTLCNYQLSPTEIANSMNNELAQNNENGMFCTMFIGLLNLVSGKLQFCNAGHNPPLLDGNFIEMEPNAPLGLWEGLEYEGQTIDDISGKQLFVYSDGLNEAENTVHGQYGDDRLQNAVRSHDKDSCQQLIDFLQHDVETHVAGADPSDDLTMLCVRKI